MSDQTIANLLINLGYVLVAVAALGCTVLPLVNALRENRKKLIPFFASIVALAIVFGIGYGIAGSEVPTKLQEMDITGTTVKYVGGMLNMTYILALLAIGGIAYSEISRALQR